jgi:hypothetical protein
LIAGKPLIAACVAFATGVLLTGLMVRR